MALTLGASYFAYRNSNLENMRRFDRAVSNLSSTLHSRMMVYVNALMHTRNLFRIKPDLSREEFHDLIHGMQLEQNVPGIQTMGYIERLSREQAARRLAEMGKTLEDAQVLPGAKEIDLVVFFERISNISSAVLGKDLGASRERKEAMNKARDLGVPVATDRVQPINSTSPTVYAFLVFLPIYKSGMDTSTVEERRRALVGFVYAGFRAENLFGRVSGVLRTRNSNLAVRVYDGEKKDPDRMMFNEGYFHEEDILLTRDVKFNSANHTWTVEVVASKKFSLPQLKWSWLFVFALGSMLSFAVMGLMIRSERLAQRLNLAREEADRANQAKSMFLANISHEIRTPLGIIMGFAQLAQQEDGKEQRDSYLNAIVRNGKELTRIIGDVLDISKIEAKTLMIEDTEFSLNELHEELRESWQSQASSKGLKFSFEKESSLPENIQSDKTRIRQILNNLLSNALKFTEQGSVSVRVGTEVDENHRAFLIYTVDDTGIGIREESREKLFKAFSQEDSSITRKFGGSGLGLAISKELSEALGGDLTACPNPHGKGSRFVFRLPLKIVGEASSAPAVSVGVEKTLKGKRVLLVEDSIDNQMLIKLMLEKHGVSVSLANNGEEGVEKALAEKYDLILMDIQMPILDGYQAFKKMKSKHIDVPVVALTAHALKEERKRALAHGFSGYLTKPIDHSQLIAVSARLTQEG